MLEDAQIGRDGQKPLVCAVSGRALRPEDVYTTIAGYKVGVKAVVYRLLTPEQKESYRAEWSKQLGAPESVPARRSRPVTPTIESPQGE